MTKLNDDALLDLAQRAVIFDWMEANGVAKIVVQFNGEGDSGDFEGAEVAVDGFGDDPYESPAFGAAQNAFARDHVAGGNPIEEFVVSMSRVVEQVTDHGVDWWNNEGGKGEVEWILDGTGSDGRHYRRGVCLFVERRIIEYEGSCFSVFGALDEEEKA